MTETGEGLDCRGLLGRDAFDAAERAAAFLRERSTGEMLERVGQTVDSLALTGSAADKNAFPASYGGGKPCDDDLLAGLGVFYVTEKGKVMLDCIGGHYQMTWGYNHPRLIATLEEATKLGVVWDNHSNIPSRPVKLLAGKLVALAGEGLDRVLLGVCTGSVACSTALKIMLARYRDDPECAELGPPVMISLDGNYHGTDMVAQTMRGMWPGLVSGMVPVQVEPNDPDALRAAFDTHGRRVAGFWAEPVMMNREAILVDTEYLQLARELCTQNGALMAMDEIQTCFWCPEVFMSRRAAVSPDFIIVGKGMTAGFHPLSGLIYRRELDILEQYDSISTNGNASLAALVGLCNIGMVEAGRERIEKLARLHYDGLCALAADFPDRIEAVNGAGFLTGIKFRDRKDAISFHAAAVQRGLWLRVHAYHPGHRTILTKHALVADEAVIEFVLGVMRDLLKQ